MSDVPLLLGVKSSCFRPQHRPCTQGTLVATRGDMYVRRGIAGRKSVSPFLKFCFQFVKGNKTHIKIKLLCEIETVCGLKSD